MLEKARLERGTGRPARPRPGAVDDPVEEVAGGLIRSAPRADDLDGALVLGRVDDPAGANGQSPAVDEFPDQRMRSRRHAMSMDLPEGAEPREKTSPLVIVERSPDLR